MKQEGGGACGSGRGARLGVMERVGCWGEALSRVGDPRRGRALGGV